MLVTVLAWLTSFVKTVAASRFCDDKKSAFTVNKSQNVHYKVQNHRTTHFFQPSAHIVYNINSIRMGEND